MTDRHPLDFTFLNEASKRLHGYLLHTWFRHYLELLVASLHRWLEQGWIGEDGRPAADRDAAVFDFNAIDIEKITYIVGFSLYIFAGHKKANFALLHRRETKRVLYLRGFDYEGATRIAGPLAVGYSSVDTLRFSHRLAEALGPEFEIFTALSPRDLFSQTTAPNFFSDYDRLIQISSEPIRSFHLNANHWQTDVADLADRVDFFVVYVSSITASVLWELDFLKARQHTARTIVVFDEEAIANKEIQTGMQDRMRELHDENVVWSKDAASAPDVTAEELRDSLARDFLVVSPDEFFAGIDEHKAHMRSANGPAVESRNAPLPFRFHPAVSAEALQEIEEFDASVEAVIREQIASRAITNLPWFLNNVQFRIFTSLMLGKHDQTGRALAVYAAVMDAVQKHRFAAPKGPVETEERELLLDHREMASYAAPRLLAHGNADEFVDNSAIAQRTYDEVFTSASDAVETFFRARSSGAFFA